MRGAGAESIVVCGALESIVHVCVAGVGSGLPAASAAVTVNVWAPLPRPVYCCGETHGEAVALSSLHVKEDAASDEVNVNDAVVSFVVPDGPSVIVVCGAVVSTVQARVAGVGSALPAASVASDLDRVGAVARPL